MKKNIIKLNSLFFILLPFIDLITSLVARFIYLPISIGMIIKGLYIFIITLYIIFYSKSKHRKTYIKYIILVSMFILLYFISKPYIFNKDYIINEISSIFKMFYGSILFFAFLVLYNDFKYKEKDINKLMFYSLITYSMLLIIPTITNTNFNTYTMKNNDGSVGWFYAANDISSIILMLYPFIYLFFIKKINNKNKKTYLYYLILLPIIYSIFIIGTKTSWLGLILITIILLVIFIITKQNKKNIYCLIITLMLTLGLTYISPAFANLNKEQDRLNNKVEIVEDSVKNTNVTEEKDQQKLEEQKCISYKITDIIKNKTIYNITHVILSGRENKAYTLYTIYKDSNFLNKLLGVGFSNTSKINNCYVERYVEMDIIDILFHYGIIGLIIIITPFIYLIKLILNNKINYNNNSIIYISIIILMIAISTVAGHVIGYPTTGIYLSLYMLLLTIHKNTKVVRE